jgi:hypothetical protein
MCTLSKIFPDGLPDCITRTNLIPKASMATSSVHSLIRNMLEDAAEQLAEELKPLRHQMALIGDGMFITHNGSDSLVVYTTLFFKAYIPKRYMEWPVVYVEWKGDETEIDIDIPIDYTV